MKDYWNQSGLERKESQKEADQLREAGEKGIRHIWRKNRQMQSHGNREMKGQEIVVRDWYVVEFMISEAEH